MNLIVAVDNNWGIGHNGNLLYNLPSDLAFFKQTTLGKVVVMGEATLHSLPGGKPLKNRTNLVLTLNPNLEVAGATVVHSLPQLFEVVKQYDTKDVFIIGGASVYEQLLPFCNTAYITKINSTQIANKFFPNIDQLPNWKLVSKSETFTENGVSFAFTVYQNHTTSPF